LPVKSFIIISYYHEIFHLFFIVMNDIFSHILFEVYDRSIPRFFGGLFHNILDLVLNPFHACLLPLLIFFNYICLHFYFQMLF